MADGAARPGTVLQLSHWPRSATPEGLRADLSAEIVLRAIDDGCLEHCGAEVATIDHFDEDGLVSLAMLVVPHLAERYGEVLVDAARTGDFGVVRSRHGALVAFAIGSLEEPHRSPVGAIERRTSSAAMGGAWTRAAKHALTVVEDLARDPAGHEELWHDEAAAYDAAVGGLGKWITVEELPEYDLAVVRVDTGQPGSEAGTWKEHAVHAAAVNTATERLRIATIAGGRFELRFRYETWVRLATYRPRLRVDLTGFAQILNEMDAGRARWTFDGANAIVPELRRTGGSGGISPETVLERLLETLPELDSGPPAWDPYV
jgi:hypothetical protein